MTAESSVGGRAPLVGALAAVLLAAVAQVTMQPASAPLVLELGLEPWHVGLAVAASAAMMLLAVPAWMRAVVRFGARGPIVGAMLIATAAMAVVALLVMLATRVAIDAWVLVVALVGLRGLALGACLAAVVPAARLVIDATQDDAWRMRGLAGIASVQGFSIVVGVAVGGGLSTFGALVPIAVAPVLLGVGAAAVAIAVPGGVRAPARARPGRSPRLVDARTWPLFVAALAVCAAIACVQIVLGFVLHERFALGPATTGFATGWVLLAGGLSAVVAQTRLARAATRATALARVGIAAAAVGVGCLALPSGFVGLLVAIVVAGVGVGLALSGIARAAGVATRDRARTQLLVGTATVLGVVAGPLVGTLLLGVGTAAPFVACAAALVGAFALALAHPAFRTAAAPTPLAETATS
ncbi:MFS transporter [Agrococcus sp. SGAir0287]|uniref:MFS transporter n=1 Tax=Agrococcus sp. SGAir0287 TaxID=2070347 RepID=UPI0010CD1FD2|nr:MFS transporter [Agrococcus sp. SGAir0287]QCR19718.1 hypothetical protein C1N71_10025 [Agrococcus sp. SGAir0287]